MSTPEWACASSPQNPTLTSRLRALRRGIQFVLGGYLVTLLVAFPAACLWLSSQEGVPLLWRAGLVGNPDAEELGLLFACVGAGLGYLLLVVGQWLCLVNAPQSHGGKELAFASLLLGLLVAPANGAALLVGGAGEFHWLRSLLHDPLAPATWTWVPIGTLLQLIGGLLLLGNILTFTQFLRALLLRAHPEKRAGRIEAFYFYVFVVVGASFGLGRAPEVLLSSPVLLPGFVLAWLVVLGWHAWLILGACGYTQVILSAPAPGDGRTRADDKEPLKQPSRCWIPLTVKLR
jgi:hypothetical protein